MSCKYPFMCDCTGCEKCAVPVISTQPTREVAQWWMALWIATILMLGLVGAVAFAMPDIIERVNTQEERT